MKNRDHIHSFLVLYFKEQLQWFNLTLQLSELWLAAAAKAKTASVIVEGLGSKLGYQGLALRWALNTLLGTKYMKIEDDKWPEKKEKRNEWSVSNLSYQPSFVWWQSNINV